MQPARPHSTTSPTSSRPGRPSRPHLVAAPLETRRLLLEPLRVEHAAEAVTVFDDARLHTYIGAAPATYDQLRSRFARQVLGRSADGAEDWLNWMARDRTSGGIAGTVQATVHHAESLLAEVAWVVAVPFQRQGLATEAAGTLIDWLRRHGVDEVIAHIHPDNQPSVAVARALGLHPTARVQDGELRWTSKPIT
jgi:RimJ/RimL family protein N-acetyltransferase